MEKEKYITQFTNKNGKKYSLEIYASSYEEAEQITEERSIGETILGKIPYWCKDCEFEIEVKE